MKKFAISMLSVAAIVTTPLTALASQPESASLEISGTSQGWAVTHGKGKQKRSFSVAADREDSSRIVQLETNPAILKHSNLPGNPFSVASLASVDGVEIAWTDGPIDAKVEIFVGDVRVAQKGAIAGNLFIPMPGGTNIPLRVSRTRVNLEATSKENNDKMLTEFVDMPITTPTAPTMPAALTALEVLSNKSVFRQATFIPWATLPAPAGACTPELVPLISYRFRGDNRSWSSSHLASYRTRFDVVIDWPILPSVVPSRNVGKTVREKFVDGKWVVDSTATASNAGMSFTLVSRSANLVHFMLKQNVTNPLCNSSLAEGIQSTTDVNYLRNGMVSGYIEYLAMPNFEIYTREDSNSYKTLAQLTLISVDCLNSLFPASGCNKTEWF